MNTAERKKKNFSLGKKLPFMKSKDRSGSEDALSADEREQATNPERGVNSKPRMLLQLKGTQVL